jgi:2-polyprenyl-3-methyl-5-hydroxy-6-metoxy-1,4-benzoquinol methylase
MDQSPAERDPVDTQHAAYAQRLRRLSSRRWKRVLNVQAPYRRYVRRRVSGSTLDLACGIGRLLQALPDGVGVDHNAECVATCRAEGLRAFTPAEFRRSEFAAEGRFDTLLAAHVLEHMTLPEAVALVEEYLPFLAPEGRVVMITPQERGYHSDPTHRTFMDFDALETLARRLGLDVVSRDSFPFGRGVGRWFPYNEFVLITRRATQRQ